MKQLIDPEQIKKYTKESVTNSFEDKSISIDKIDFNENIISVSKQDNPMEKMIYHSLNHTPEVTVLKDNGEGKGKTKVYCTVQYLTDKIIYVSWLTPFDGEIIIK